jgi:hypothetical protein
MEPLDEPEVKDNDEEIRIDEIDEGMEAEA